MYSSAAGAPFNLKISPVPFPDANCLRAACDHSPGPPELQRPYRLTPLSLSFSMGIKPECPPAPARNSGCHKPSEAPPRRIIRKRDGMQFNDIFTELRDNITSLTVIMAKEGEDGSTKDPQGATPKTIIDEVS